MCSTATLLDNLAAAGARATLFVRPDLLFGGAAALMRRAIAAGHSIGVLPTGGAEVAALDPPTLARTLAAGDAAVHSALCLRPRCAARRTRARAPLRPFKRGCAVRACGRRRRRYFRPPGLESDVVLTERLESMGYVVVTASVRVCVCVCV